jgi:hypothetical protein
VILGYFHRLYFIHVNGSNFFKISAPHIPMCPPSKSTFNISEPKPNDTGYHITHGWFALLPRRYFKLFRYYFKE